MDFLLICFNVSLLFWSFSTPFIYIAASQNVQKLILKSPRFVSFGANLTQFGWKIWHRWMIPWFHLPEVSTNLEESFGTAGVDGSVLYLCLSGQVLGGVDGRQHPLYSEESCQVSGVGGDDDQREEPPHWTHDTTWDWPVGVNKC